MRRPMHRSRPAFVALLVCLGIFLVSCSDPEYAGRGDWRSQYNEPGPQVQPQPEEGEPGAPGPSSSDPSSSETGDPLVKAKGLDQPWGIAALPDGTALVGERTTGKVFKVFPDARPQQLVTTIPGIDASGEGGLLGMTVAPSYLQTGLVYAYITTATDNRVVSFAIGGSVQPLLTGIPKGATHNGGGLAIGPDGLLYVGTGDTGQPSLATDTTSLAGKVLRVDEFGEGKDGGSPVVARGLADATGVCLGATVGYVVDGVSGTVGDPADDALFALEADQDYSTAAPLVDYGAEADPTGAGACAVLSTSPMVTMLEGKALWTTVLNKKGQAAADPEKSLTNKYGRLRGIALDLINGGVWVSTSNRDGHGKPVKDDDRVLLIPPPAGGGGGIT